MPSDGRPRHLVVSLALALVVVAAIEAGWRSFGLPPSITDDYESWVQARLRVRPGSTVFIGASRVQAGLDPAVWEEATGEHAVQLALPAASPLPLLRELAADRSFEGSVVVGFMSSIFFNVEWEQYAARSRDALLALRDGRRFWAHPAATVEARLAGLAEGRLVARNPSISPRRSLELLLTTRDFGVLRYSSVRRDRFAPRDFEAIDARRHMIQQRDAFRGRGRPASDVERDSLIRELDEVTRTLGARGVRVVFVRMPVCGLMLELEEAEYPLDRYWSEMVRSVSAPAIDFRDYPTLTPDRCYDGSHLDRRVSGAFTRALVGIVADVPTG